MADTATSNYGWVKPEVGASNDTWGAKLNANFDAVDAKVKSLDFSSTAKTTPVNADRVALFDSAASNAAKYVTVENLKAAVDTPVTSDSIIAALGYTPVNPTRQIIAGVGLTGGGSLAADRTVAIGTPTTITGSTTNTVSGTTHAHALTLVSADITGALGYTPVNPTRQIVAGNGMTGGGALSADRTLTLGTPGSITNSTTNSVSTSSHVHALGFVAAEVYTGSTLNAVTFGIGHIVAVYTTTPDRNGSTSVRLHESDNRLYNGSGSGGLLTGTYRSRGGISSSTIMQRTA